MSSRPRPPLIPPIAPTPADSPHRQTCRLFFGRLGALFASDTRIQDAPTFLSRPLARSSTRLFISRSVPARVIARRQGQSANFLRKQAQRAPNRGVVLVLLCCQTSGSTPSKSS